MRDRRSGRIAGGGNVPAPESVGVKVNSKQILTMFKLAFEDWCRHNATRLGAALAFYTVWSIAPLVILAVAIASFFFAKSTAQGQLLDQVQSMVGYQGVFRCRQYCNTDKTSRRASFQPLLER